MLVLGWLLLSGEVAVSAHLGGLLLGATSDSGPSGVDAVRELVFVGSGVVVAGRFGYQA